MDGRKSEQDRHGDGWEKWSVPIKKKKSIFSKLAVHEYIYLGFILFQLDS